MLAGADEEAQGREERFWRAGVLAPPFSPEKGGKREQKDMQEHTEGMVWDSEQPPQESLTFTGRTTSLQKCILLPAS